MIRETLRPFVAAGTAALCALWTWAGFVALAPVGAFGVTLTPSPPVARGPAGGALSLDGSSALVVDRFRVPLDAFTVECWVKAETPRATENLFGDTADGGVELVWYDADRNCPVDRPNLWLRTTRTLDSAHAGWTASASTERAKQGEWTHVAVTVDGRRMRLFLDGRIVSETAVFGEPVASRVPLVIGGDANDEGRPVDRFVGLLDEVRVSRGVRYDGPFRPEGRLATDPSTMLHLSFDGLDDPFRDDGPLSAAVTPWGTPQIVSAE